MNTASVEGLQGLPVILLAFLVGGVVKGILGIGLPLITVPVIATFSNPLHAISLMLVPALSSNIMQARQAGLTFDTVRRYWVVCLGVGTGSVLGVTVLAGVDTTTAKAALGVIVVLFCMSQLLGALPPMGNRARRWATPVLGAASGFVGGLSGFFGLVLVPYLLSLGLAKEAFVATIALLYLSGVTTLYTVLALQGVFDVELIAISALAAMPTLAGVWLGSRLRRRVPEGMFRRLLVIVLLVIALNLLRQSLSG